jgi:hypothetical protein
MPRIIKCDPRGIQEIGSNERGYHVHFIHKNTKKTCFVYAVSCIGAKERAKAGLQRSLKSREFIILGAEPVTDGPSGPMQNSHRKSVSS